MTIGIRLILGIFGAPHKRDAALFHAGASRSRSHAPRPRAARARISGVAVREPRLRWPVPRDVLALAGARCARSAAAASTCSSIAATDLILHLGMSGSLRVLPPGTPAQSTITSTWLGDRVLRLRDPRRFGAVLWTTGDADAHPLLAHLGIEPLSRGLDPRGCMRSRARTASIKTFLMDGRRIVGVGNIYASEPVPRRHPRNSAPAHARAMRAPRQGDQGHAARGDPRGRLDAARLRRRGRRNGLLPEPLLGLRPRRAEMPALRR